jgi:hypothetical protein
MTEKQSYLYSSPEGVIKLIEGDKMPVKPYHPCEQLPDRGCPICAGYKLDLWAAKKENAVTVADQEKALNLMWRNDPNMHNPISFGDWKHAILKSDTIYGPFSLRYEIQTLHYCKQCGAYKSIKRIPCQNAYCGKTSENVAILYDDTPEKEHPGLRDALREVKAKNKELRDSYKDPTRLDFRIKDSRGFPTGEVVEGAKVTPEKEDSQDQETLWSEVDKIFNTKWTYGMPDDVMQELKEKFTITRK